MSLIEALVALAVMAIGMLGLVASGFLSSSSDLAKQRSGGRSAGAAGDQELRAFQLPDSGVRTGFADLADGPVAPPALSAPAPASRGTTRRSFCAAPGAASHGGHDENGPTGPTSRSRCACRR